MQHPDLLYCLRPGLYVDFVLLKKNNYVQHLQAYSFSSDNHQQLKFVILLICMVNKTWIFINLTYIQNVVTIRFEQMLTKFQISKNGLCLTGLKCPHFYPLMRHQCWKIWFRFRCGKWNTCNSVIKFSYILSCDCSARQVVQTKNTFETQV